MNLLKLFWIHHIYNTWLEGKQTRKKIAKQPTHKKTCIGVCIHSEIYNLHCARYLRYNHRFFWSLQTRSPTCKEGAPLVFTCWAIPQVNWVANINEKFWDFFHLLTTFPNWSCPSTLSRYVRCSSFLALTRARTFACSQLGSLGFLDCNSTDSALWAFFPFPFLFFLVVLVALSWGRCTTNMTTAKQGTINH